MWDEVALWPELQWGTHVTLALGDVSRISVELPDVSMLPLDCTPAGRSSSGSGGASEAAAGLAALVDDLDPDTGLPLCLLPQAYGQQVPAIGPFDEVDVWTPFTAVIEQLWTLWELVLLGEPLLVMAPTPGPAGSQAQWVQQGGQQDAVGTASCRPGASLTPTHMRFSGRLCSPGAGGCSSAVAALLALIAPFPPAVDFRPYFTIHDPAFAGLASGTRPSGTNGLPSLLGATNLYFLKALPDFPNVSGLWGSHPRHARRTGPLPMSLRTPWAPSVCRQQLQASPLVCLPLFFQVLSTGYTAATQPPSGGMLPSGGTASAAGNGGSRLVGLLSRWQARAHALLEQGADSAWLNHRPLVRPNKGVLASLSQPAAGAPLDQRRHAAALNTGILLRHFQELTKAVLFPLLPYITPAQPSEEEPPPLPALDPGELLASLAGRDARLPEVLLRQFGGQRRLVEFYQRLLASPGLQAWLGQRRRAAEVFQTAYSQHTMAATETYYAIAERLLQHRNSGDEEQESLQTQLRLAFAAMPTDLQHSLLLSPRG